MGEISSGWIYSTKICFVSFLSFCMFLKIVVWNRLKAIGLLRNSWENFAKSDSFFGKTLHRVSEISYYSDNYRQNIVYLVSFRNKG